MKGPIVKRYIIAGLGALALAGAGVATAMTLTPPSDLATATDAPPYSVTFSPTASPSGSASPSEGSKTPDATATPSALPKPPEEPTVANYTPPADPDSTAPINSNNPLANQKKEPGQEPALSAPQQMKTRSDGSIYFVDATTGKEVQQPESTTPGGGTNNTAPKPIDAPGAGSQQDKLNVATSYMNHLNALYNGKWDEACRYVALPAGVSASDCAAKFQKRTTAHPLTSTYSINNVNPVDVQGNNATMSPLALKDSNGDGTRAIPLTRSGSNPAVWLIDGKSLLEIN